MDDNTIARTLHPQVILVNRALIKNNQNQILIVKRCDTNSHNVSMWELPGGKMDVDQDVEAALKREILEETGLVVISMEHTAYWQSYIVPQGKYVGMPFVELVIEVKCLGYEVVLSAEHSDFKWVGPHEILNYDLTPEGKKAISFLLKF